MARVQRKPTFNKREQMAVLNLWMRGELWRWQSYAKFRRTATYNYLNQCIMVHWKGMWVGIEDDGHTHT